MKRNNVYAKSEEKYVMNVVLYADSDDGHVFYDSAKSVKIPKVELKDLFEKGCIVVFDGSEYAPVAFKDNGADAHVVVINDTTNYTFYSAEHGA